MLIASTYTQGFNFFSTYEQIYAYANAIVACVDGKE